MVRPEEKKREGTQAWKARCSNKQGELATQVSRNITNFQPIQGALEFQFEFEFWIFFLYLHLKFQTKKPPLLFINHLEIDKI